MTMVSGTLNLVLLSVLLRDRAVTTDSVVLHLLYDCTKYIKSKEWSFFEILSSFLSANSKGTRVCGAIISML